MKNSPTLALVLSALLLTTSGLTQAQSLKPPTESARMAAFMDRDVFLSMHRWDEMTGMWVVKSNIELPKGVMPRSEVMAMAEKFVLTNTWNVNHGNWVPISARKLSAEEMRDEMTRFMLTHRFDESTGAWVSKMKYPVKN